MADRAVMIVLGTKMDAGAQAAVNKLKGQIGGLQKQSELGDFGKGLAGGLPGLSMLAGGAAGVASQITSALVEGVKAAFDESLRMLGEQRRFKAYFGNLTPLATEWADELSVKTGYCEKEIGALMGQVYNLGRGLGMTTGESSALTKSFSQLALDFAAFQGMQPAEAFQVLQSAIAGRFRSLSQYGILFTDQERKNLEALKETGDEAQYTAEIIDKLNEKMGAMKGAAGAEGVSREMREIAAVKAEALGEAGKNWGAAAVAWEKAKAGLVLIFTGELGRLLGSKVFSNSGQFDDEIKRDQARQAAVIAALQEESEQAARAKEKAREENRIYAELKKLELLKEQIAKLKELEEAAKSGDSAATAAAEKQAAVVRQMFGDQEAVKRILGEEAALRKSLGKEGGFASEQKKALEEFLKLDKQRAETAQKIAEAREKEAKHAAELYGSMSALERAQARQVLGMVQTGGVNAYQQLGEKGRNVLEKLDPEKAKEYARQVAEREGFAGMVGPAGAGKVNVATLVKTEITAKLELDGPSLAQQFLEKLWPSIMQIVTQNIDSINSGIRLGQAAGQAVAGAL